MLWPERDSLAEVARELDVSPATLRRWAPRGHRAAARRRAGRRRRSPRRGSSRACARAGTRWTRSASAAQRAGSPTATWRTCSRRRGETRSLEEAAERDRARAGADPSGSGRAVGFPPRRSSDELSDDDLAAAALHRPRCWTPGFPLVAFLQLVRVYGQALAQIADAEVKLFHLYVHEPLIRDGVAGARDRRGDGGPGARAAAARRADHGPRPPALPAALPRAGRRRPPRARGRPTTPTLGRLRVAIAFADLAGYTRLTEEAGEEEALDVVERFVEAVERDAARRRARDQDDRRRGDGRRLRRRRRCVDWAVGFQQLADRAAAAADRHPRRRRALPRRRLLRPRGQPRRAGRRARGRRRGARHARRSSRPPGRTSRSSHRRGQAQGLRRGDRAVPGAARRERSRRASAPTGCSAGRAGAGAALRRARLGLPARPRGAAWPAR